MNAAETHETFHQESGMRYQVSSLEGAGPLLATVYEHKAPHNEALEASALLIERLQRKGGMSGHAAGSTPVHGMAQPTAALPMARQRRSLRAGRLAASA